MLRLHVRMCFVDQGGVCVCWVESGSWNVCVVSISTKNSVLNKAALYRTEHLDPLSAFGHLTICRILSVHNTKTKPTCTCDLSVNHDARARCVGFSWNVSAVSARVAREII